MPLYLILSIKQGRTKDSLYRALALKIGECKTVCGVLEENVNFCQYSKSLLKIYFLAYDYIRIN